MKKFICLFIATCTCFSAIGHTDVPSTREVLKSYAHDHQEIAAGYNALVAKWEAYKHETPNWDMDRLLLAIEYAAKKHAGQVRKDTAKSPYIIHPIGVTAMLWDIGNVRSVNVLTAGLLHDALEDTDATETEIEALFGPRVLYTVKEVTNDPTLKGDAIKQWQVDHAPTMSLDAQLVKLADRLYNVSDLTTSPPPSWSQEKVESYRDWGRKLLAALRGANQPLEEALETRTQA